MPLTARRPSQEIVDIVGALGGTWSGNVAMCRCPAHSDRDPSLSIRQGDRGILVTCFAGCSREDVLRELRLVRPGRHYPPPALADSPRPMNVERIWNEAVDVPGTLAERYLQCRNLLPPPRDLRFHPRCPYLPKPKTIFEPALLVAVREGNRLVAIQRIFLNPDTAHYTRKVMLGAPGHGAWRGGAGGNTLAIAEGFETADAFARLREQYETILRDVSVLAAVRLEKCYLKHGTSIAVRLFVIDKVPGRSPPALIQRSSVAELLDILIIPERSSAKPDRGASAPKRSGGVSLFRAVKSSRPAPRAYHAPARNHVLPVEYAKLETPAPLLEQSGVYLPYRPSRISFASAGEHPTPLVESVAMGSIPAPVPEYVPALPERTVAERLLSASQLETVVYAGHAWTQWIPGTFRPDKEGVGLVLAEDGHSYRKGFFLGDGTGAGKGRQIAACILDNWLQGRRRNIWVSKNAPLLEDARRDWTALGGLNGDIQPISNWKIDEPISLDQGVLFVSYPTLRSMRGDYGRLKQLVDWAGADFDGVIAFDEAHEMGGVAGGEGALGTKDGSQQGICGVLLQNQLPAARVLYASATGASVVNNLAYAVRLGLWGPTIASGKVSIRRRGSSSPPLAQRRSPKAQTPTRRCAPMANC